MNKARKKVEEKVYKVMDILDPTKKNSSWYKQKFARMSDKEFVDFFKTDFPLKYQVELFKTEPTMDKIDRALKFIKVPMTERVCLPFLYEDDEGKGVYTEPALVVYTPSRRMQQMSIKKQSMSTNISKRSMSDGLLMMDDKNGGTSSREFEALAVMGAEETIKELSGIRADAMEAKSESYMTINQTGMLSMKDYKISKEESPARNKLNVFFLGALLNSNLINEGDYLINTLKNKQRRTERE